MSVAKLIGASVLVLCAVAAGIFLRRRETHVVYEPPVIHVEPASPCSWRDAEQDMTNWFPGATEYCTRDLILSGQRAELQQKLGRTLQPEEMALHTYLVQRNNQHIGTALTRRFKGEHGAIEFVLALDPQREIREFKIQRIREPDEVVRQLEAFNVREQVLRLNTSSTSKTEPANLRNAPAENIAATILAEVRALLVLFEAGQAQLRIQQHHH